MKKKSKYLLAAISLFFALSTTVNAATIKETTVKGDGFDTISSGDIVIGITRFDGNTVVTGTKVAKASTNDSVHFLKENNSLDSYTAPVIYVYTGVGGWFSLDDDNKASMVSDSSLISKLENSNIYYVNNIEKKLEIDIKGIDIDESSLPKGVKKENDKLIVNATLGSFDVKTSDGASISYIINEGKYNVDQSKYYTVDDSGFITSYNGPSGKVEVLSKINGKNIVGIRKGAFDNKGITSVVIPESIMTIEANAFSNNNIESVIVSEKYDEGDFTNLADNAFGTFTDIKYDNDLTRLLSAFKDELTLNVQKDYDYTDDYGKYALPRFALSSEEKRLNLGEYSEETKDSYIYRTLNDIKDGSFTLTLRKMINDRSKIVSKNIKYSVNKVNGTTNAINDIDKAEKEYNAYYKKVKEGFEKDTSLALASTEKMKEIYGYYNVDCVFVDYGEGFEDYADGLSFDGGEGTTAVSVGDILYGVKDFSVINSVVYGLDVINDSFDNDEDYINYALGEFSKITKVSDYEILNKNNYGTYMNGNKKCYQVDIKDNRNDNTWYIEFRNNYDETAAYQIDSSGYITGYTGIGGDIIIPSKIGETDVVGIRTGAFNRYLASVTIPESVMNIESNAFSSSVYKIIIKGKYDKNDFTSLDDNAFASNTKLEYSNDLTDALSLFKDELTLNVQKDFDINADAAKYSISDFAVLSETTRINDKNIVPAVSLATDETGESGDTSNSVIVAYMTYKSDNKLQLELSKVANETQKKVTKTISYSIKKVDGDAKYIENIKKALKENKDNVDNIKKNFASDTSIKLDSITDYQLLNKYGLKAFNVGMNENVDENISLGNVKLYSDKSSMSIYSDDILYGNYDFEHLSSGYEFTGDASKYNNEDEIYNYILNEFSKDTKITDYEIVKYGDSESKYSYVDVVNKKVTYTINVVDNRNENNWYIQMGSNISDDFTIEKNYGSYISTQYFPNLPYENYNNMNDWINAALDKFKEKSGITDIQYYSFGLLESYNGTNIEYKADKDGNYNYVYELIINQSDSNVTTGNWKLYLYKTTNKKIETEEYESTFKDRYGVIEDLVSKKGLTNYFVQDISRYYKKDSNTNKFTLSNPDNYTHMGFKVYDVTNDKIYMVYYIDK